MEATSSGQPIADGAVIRVFGGMGVEQGGEPLSIGGPRQRRLLALLAAESGSVVTIDWLAEYLWDDGDRPDVVAPTLRTNVSRLRQSLPGTAQDWIQTEMAGYRLEAPPGAIETERFAALRAEANRCRGRGDPLAAKDLLDEALGLWRGAPFRELEDIDWARAQIEQLNLDRLEMLEERWEAELALGRHTQITGELAAFTAEHGLRERAARQYAIALHRSGRTAEALRVLRNHRNTVADESGLDPSPAIAELEEALLAGDPSLDFEGEGRSLRGYQLLEQAGIGAFAVVWRATQPSVDREVAIKQIRAELATQPEFIRRFESEAHLVARIEHPHIVPLIDYWRDPDSAYLVMRWLGGGTLERRLDDGPLSVDETLTVAREIGSALAAAHAQGIVHRDVKTSNIIFDEQGNSFLTDFGIALEATESAGPEAALSPGSPAYSSPEQIRREPLGPEADVFSLGVVIFECLTGRLPFADSPSAEALIERQLHMPYPTLTELRADVPLAVSLAVARATAKDPTERFSSVPELLTAVELASDAVDTAPPVRDVANPYNGLRAFDDGDTDRFFGRERFVSELVGRLAGNTVRSRCQVVVGPSGSGKSSVVRAGLVPAVRGGAVPGSADWFVTTMVPGGHPFEALEASLLRIAVNPPSSLLEQLRNGDRGVLRATRRCLGGDDDRLILIVDQFEELFTRSSQETANAFLDALSVAVEDPSSPLIVVATLRADYYDRPLWHPRFAPLLKTTAIDLTPLAPDELERAIVEPARRLGVEIEPGLAARIAAESLGQPAPLPLLQYAMSELFDHRDGSTLTADAYDELGGLSGALAARAEALYADGDEGQRAAVRRVFGRMTNPGHEVADVRRRVRLADLGHDPAIAWVLEQFGGARLLTFDRESATREPTVEVAHEALLREWPRLAAWLEEDRELLRSLDGIAVAASSWDEGGRQRSDLYRGGRLERAVDLSEAAPDRLRPVDSEFIAESQQQAQTERRAERRRVRRLRGLVAGVGIALVVALVAGAIALRQRNQAQSLQEEAELATLISRSSATAAEEPELSLLLALEAHRRSPEAVTEQAVLAALGQTSLGAVVANHPRLNDPSGECPGPFTLNSDDGSAEYRVRNGTLASLDVATGTITDHGSPPAPCAVWLGDEQAGRRWATDGELRHWFGPLDGPFHVEIEFGEYHHAWGRELTGDRMIFSTDDGDALQLVDTMTGETVGSPLRGLRAYFPAGQAVNGDGTLVAVAGISPDAPGAPDGDGRVHVVDAATGVPVFHVDTAFETLALAFDDASGELIAATGAGRIVTIDLATGQVVADVETSTASMFVQVGVRPDGLIVAVSEGQIELVDRRAGPTGQVIELQEGLAGARVRPDGSVVVLTIDDRAVTYDIGTSAVAERTFEVDPFAAVWIGAGTAIVSGSESLEHVEVIDLGTGERSILELTTPSGDRFIAEEFGQPYVFGVSGGHVAATPNGNLARWESGRLVEELTLAATETDRALWLRDFGDQLALLREPPAGPRQTHLITASDDGLQLQFTIDTRDAVSVAPTPDDGVYVLNIDGTLQAYDSSGLLAHVIATGMEIFSNERFTSAQDEVTGRLAFGGREMTAIIDPATDEVELLPQLSGVDALGFVRNGELLVVVGTDGDVTLWDVERGESAGLIWDGTGASPGSYPFYDESTTTLYVATSGRILQVSLDRDRWLERACELAGRDLTQDEWDRFVPGGGTVRSACDDLGL